ncbi:hypothetical protein NE236_11670 [Actinoallomurus purpureus]|uniref:hypothetical protein n=1 Tax=Actinoallomurus purpureus TaxID=478114 RepID=UPI002093D5DB|nr:hypothetical protein [Actinoallomurus purpureus]MCO6005640.1 hypothetical protein [Actinoallomurus purpureus]
MTAEEMDLVKLQVRWGGGWRIWRGRRYCDVGDERTGDWIATRIDAAAGVWPTVMRATPEALDEALHQQLAMVARGVTQPRISEAGPE